MCSRVGEENHLCENNIAKTLRIALVGCVCVCVCVCVGVWVHLYYLPDNAHDLEFGLWEPPWHYQVDRFSVLGISCVDFIKSFSIYSFTLD